MGRAIFHNVNTQAGSYYLRCSSRRSETAPELHLPAVPFHGSPPRRPDSFKLA